MKQLGHIFYCKNCGNRGSSNFPPEKCSECGELVDYAGPLWLGELHNSIFIKKMTERNNERKYADKEEIAKMLGGVSRPALTMKVVVGRALRTETPVFGEELRYIVFRPWWNIPASIARNETLPAARRDPGYLAAHDMEIVAGDRDDSPVVPPTPESLGRVGPGGLRIRQRPGPQNALGRVKFIFPNNANVYLHDTPSPGAFRHDRRELSHGCVRLADPAALAEWLLRDVPGWSRERIEKAMREDAPQQVNLRAAVPVLLLYVTAVVDVQGQAAFFEDIYGHDRRLDALLRGGEPQSP